VVGATLPFLPLMRHERGQGRTGLRTTCPPLFRVAPSTVIPGRKAEVLKTWFRIVLLKLALTAAGLRA